MFFNFLRRFKNQFFSHSRRTSLICAAFLFFTAFSYAQSGTGNDFYWRGGAGDNLWSNGNNWVDGSGNTFVDPPGMADGDNVYFDQVPSDAITDMETFYDDLTINFHNTCGDAVLISGGEGQVSTSVINVIEGEINFENINTVAELYVYDNASCDSKFSVISGNVSVGDGAVLTVSGELFAGGNLTVEENGSLSASAIFTVNGATVNNGGITLGAKGNFL